MIQWHFMTKKKTNKQTKNIFAALESHTKGHLESDPE